MSTSSCMRGRLQPTNHRPAKGRRSRPRPRLARFRSRWCSPLPSFYWRRSSLLCPWTGSPSRRWTPTCKRHGEHPVRPASTPQSHWGPANHPTNPAGKGMFSDDDDVILLSNPACRRHTSQGHAWKRPWLCNVRGGCSRPFDTTGTIWHMESQRSHIQ